MHISRKSTKVASGLTLALLGLAVIFLAGGLPAQSKNLSSNAALEAKVAALQKQVNASMPGVGEFMGVVQMHHIKLYYAGSSGNWPLAKYELGEMQETFNDIETLYTQKFKKVRMPLSKLMPEMINPSMNQLRQAIHQKNEKAFVAAYKNLSSSCSDCHAAANDPFIKIQVPAKGMYSDQKFTP